MYRCWDVSILLFTCWYACQKQPWAFASQMLLSQQDIQGVPHHWGVVGLPTLLERASYSQSWRRQQDRLALVQVLPLGLILTANPYIDAVALLQIKTFSWGKNVFVFELNLQDFKLWTHASYASVKQGVIYTVIKLIVGFLRKVYGILSMQLCLTIIVSALFMFIEPVKTFVQGR